MAYHLPRLAQVSNMAVGIHSSDITRRSGTLLPPSVTVRLRHRTAQSKPFCSSVARRDARWELSAATLGESRTTTTLRDSPETKLGGRPLASSATRPLDGVSFTPGGLLFPYYCGVSAALEDLGLISDQTRLAGSSAGAIIAVFIASGLSHRYAMEAFRTLLADITANGTFGRLGSVLRRMLREYLPEDIAMRASGRVTIGMTNFGGFQRLPFDAVLVDQFHSKEDLIDAVCASCHIPFYLGPTVGSTFRGQELSDGAVTAFLPPAVPNIESPATVHIDGLRSIGVCAVPLKGLGSEFLGQNLRGVAISPSLQPQPRFGFLKLSIMGLLPFTPAEGEELFQLGLEDTVAWAAMSGSVAALHELHTVPAAK